MAARDEAKPAPAVDGEGKAVKVASASSDAGREQAQDRMDIVTEQGFRGVAVDPTPNENYTVAGVTASKPTPETDVDLEAEARGPGPLAAAEAEAEALGGKS